MNRRTLFPELQSPSSATDLLPDTPPYALKVFLPLLDVINEVGLAKFVLTSHLKARAWTFHKVLTTALDKRMLGNWSNVIALLLRV